jgi:hypothetical protein
MGMEGKAAGAAMEQVKGVPLVVATPGEKIARTVFFTAELKRQVSLAVKIDRAIAAAVHREYQRGQRDANTMDKGRCAQISALLKSMKEERVQWGLAMKNERKRVERDLVRERRDFHRSMREYARQDRKEAKLKLRAMVRENNQLRRQLRAKGK